MPTAVDGRVKKLVADEKHAARVARTEKAKQLRDQAQRELEAKARTAERAAKKQLADQIEAELRSTRTPYCKFHANGKVVTVMLGGAEPIAAGVAVEAARRVAYQCAHRFQDLVVASRAAGQVVPEVDWIPTAWNSEGGLLYAVRRGLVTVKDEAEP